MVWFSFQSDRSFWLKVRKILLIYNMKNWKHNLYNWATINKISMAKIIDIKLKWLCDAAVLGSELKRDRTQWVSKNMCFFFYWFCFFLLLRKTSKYSVKMIIIIICRVLYERTCPTSSWWVSSLYYTSRNNST